MIRSGWEAANGSVIGSVTKSPVYLHAESQDDA